LLQFSVAFDKGFYKKARVGGLSLFIEIPPSVSSSLACPISGILSLRSDSMAIRRETLGTGKWIYRFDPEDVAETPRLIESKPNKLTGENISLPRTF
jgi:hypothetical protein